jgi:uncharacterized protein with HEPN domain
MPKDRHALMGILDAIQAIEQYTAPFSSAEDLFASQVHFDATLMNFIVIGEMVDRISDTFKADLPEIDWKKVKGLRNIIAHDYFGVDAEEIWQICKSQIPALKVDVQKVLKKSS